MNRTQQLSETTYLIDMNNQLITNQDEGQIIIRLLEATIPPFNHSTFDGVILYYQYIQSSVTYTVPISISGYFSTLGDLATALQNAFATAGCSWMNVSVHNSEYLKFKENDMTITSVYIEPTTILAKDVLGMDIGQNLFVADEIISPYPADLHEALNIYVKMNLQGEKQLDNFGGNLQYLDPSKIVGKVPIADHTLVSHFFDNMGSYQVNIDQVNALSFIELSIVDGDNRPIQTTRTLSLVLEVLFIKRPLNAEELTVQYLKSIEELTRLQWLSKRPNT